MSEPNFAALRQDLESQTQPPQFAQIRARRLRRTQRWAMAGIAGATVLAVAGTAFAVGGLRGNGSPPLPGATPTPSATPTPHSSATGQPSASPPTGPEREPVRSTVDMLLAAPSGVLYAAADPEPCTGCSADLILLHSTDTGTSWQPVGPFQGLPEDLVAGSGARLWTIDAGGLHGSLNGGKTWQRWTLPRSSDDWRIPQPSAAGDTVWVAKGAQVLVESGAKPPVKAAKLPTSAGRVTGITAVDHDRAVVQTTNDSTLKAAWFATTDRGAHWTAFADPCAGTRFAASAWSTLAAAPGALWAACAGSPGAGQQPKELVVSTDGGHTWQHRGPLESSGYGTKISPISATVAWRSGDRADIFRTVDGTQWTDVAKAGDNNPDVRSFAAVNATTAVYVSRAGSGPALLTYVTRDGGKTWTAHPGH
jgi:photosystem II stability/assembly factor-like uncharacterized protein